MILVVVSLAVPEMAVNRAVMAQWADATRGHRWDEADKLWQQLMADWLVPPAVSQSYWGDLLDLRIAAIERKEQRSAIGDDQWDHLHEDVNR
jgi:hypothetical protein